MICGLLSDLPHHVLWLSLGVGHRTPAESWHNAPPTVCRLFSFMTAAILSHVFVLVCGPAMLQGVAVTLLRSQFHNWADLTPLCAYYQWPGFFAFAQAVSFTSVSLSLVQSLDTLPMHGRDFGVNPDDLVETPEPENEAKQEILENKDVSCSSSSSSSSSSSISIITAALMYKVKTCSIEQL